MNIYLIGLPGSGKSTLGRELAKHLGYAYVDTDAILAEREQDTIEAIFKKHGEAYFRKVEQATLHEVSTGDNQLISTGGGLPCFFDNMRLINANGVSIYIDVPVKTLVARITTSTGNIRPMVKNKSADEVTDFLIAKKREREPFYTQAKLTVSGSNIKLKDIIEGLKSKNLI